MIAIQKGAAPPALDRARKKHVGTLCAAYNANPDLYRSGKEKMKVLSSVYASKTVKAALKACHHGKCCYCETVINVPYADAHVEHWRPKLSSRQARKQKSIWPGYYWLAYSWENLLLSCAFCNRDNKRDLFPLKNPGARALHHAMDVRRERPAILKPDGDMDPRDHITFKNERPIWRTSLGRRTIEVLGLDSPKHKRSEYLNEEIVKRRQMYIDLRGIDHPIARKYAEHAREFVERAVQPERPYSAMVAAYLEANPWPEP